ncbi:MAG: CPXCG motif-containing cysteine-rich protein [Verrucomicrobia bacterium]|nr:MAG: CPXCG motif-containing cysteine-rich protein [Verrucomicrobiota bacterium]
MQPVVSVDITCPHCGETFSLEVDTSQSEQDLIADCSVCCRPINVTIRRRPGEVVALASNQEPCRFRRPEADCHANV